MSDHEVRLQKRMCDNWTSNQYMFLKSLQCVPSVASEERASTHSVASYTLMTCGQTCLKGRGLPSATSRGATLFCMSAGLCMGITRMCGWGGIWFITRGFYLPCTLANTIYLNMKLAPFSKQLDWVSLSLLVVILDKYALVLESD